MGAVIHDCNGRGKMGGRKIVFNMDFLWESDMPQAMAYCEEVERNITLDEAHVLYFRQPIGRRHRFNFRCGDPRCRAMLQPLVVAALYDKEDKPGEKYRSPYFREHPSHPHILSCTWINPDQATGGAPHPEQSDTTASGSVLQELGLIFKVDGTRPSGGQSSGPPDQRIRETEASDSKEHRPTARPMTSKFMATVAAAYLKYTDAQRQSTGLSIEAKCKGTFYSICMPILGYHPHFQAERIYHGRVKVAELTNVFFIRFLAKMSPTGDKSNRNTIAEIKLTKRWLEENDRMMATILQEVASQEFGAWCFFYTETALVMNKSNAQFTVSNPAHIAVIGEREIAVLEPSPE